MDLLIIFLAGTLCGILAARLWMRWQAFKRAERAARFILTTSTHYGKEGRGGARL